MGKPWEVKGKRSIRCADHVPEWSGARIGRETKKMKDGKVRENAIKGQRKKKTIGST